MFVFHGLVGIIFKTKYKQINKILKKIFIRSKLACFLNFVNEMQKQKKKKNSWGICHCLYYNSHPLQYRIY